MSAPRPDLTPTAAPRAPAAIEPAAQPPRRTRVVANWTAALVALLYLAIALPRLGDYGPTWDCVVGEYPYGERLLGYLETGDEAFLDLGRLEPAPVTRAPHPDFDLLRQDPRWAHPFAPLLSAVACRLLWTELGWVPAMQAHHFVIPLFTAVLLFVLVRFAAVRAGPLAGVLSGVLLIASPRFFAHSLDNLKDTPETALYFLTAVAGYAALRSGRRATWALCGVLAGAALAQKPNALFLPPFLIAFAVLALWLQRRSAARATGAHAGAHAGEHEVRWSWTGFGLAALAMLAGYYALSPGAWTHPVEGGLEHIGRHLQVGSRGDATTPIPLPGEPKSNPVSAHGLLHVLWTTPLAVLLLAPLGLFERRLSGATRVFLALGVAVPIGRTLLPGMVNFDGVRHFLEFWPFLALLAGCGLAWLVRTLARRGPLGVALAAGAVALAVAPGALATARTSPNGICYYNALVGGLAGARERGITDAYDYWANSYWQGLHWVAGEAPPGARALAPVAEWVAQSAAPVVLPPGVAYWSPESPHTNGPLYVLCLETHAWLGPFQARLTATRDPVHEIRVQDATILRVYRLDGAGEVESALDEWRAEQIGYASLLRCRDWLVEHPDKLPALAGSLATHDREGPAAGLAQLRALLPEGLHEGLAEALWYLKASRSPGAALPPPRPAAVR